MYALAYQILKTCAVLCGLFWPFFGLLRYLGPALPREPRYLFEIGIEPVFENDWQNMVQLLLPLAKEAGAFIEQREQKIFIQAMSEPQVESIADALKNLHKMEFKLGEPEVLYCSRGISLNGDPLLWEPIMKVIVTTPEIFADEIERGLRNRRGRQLKKVDHDGGCCISALVPLEDMFGYGIALRSISDGKASYFIVFDYFSPRPPDDNPPKRPAMIMRE